MVLRIEVLESGDPGRIEIDASSGSQQVDQAAVDYARIQPLVCRAGEWRASAHVGSLGCAPSGLNRSTSSDD